MLPKLVGGLQNWHNNKTSATRRSVCGQRPCKDGFQMVQTQPAGTAATPEGTLNRSSPSPAPCPPTMSVPVSAPTAVAINISFTTLDTALANDVASSRANRSLFLTVAMLGKPSNWSCFRSRQIGDRWLYAALRSNRPFSEAQARVGGERVPARPMAQAVSPSAAPLTWLARPL